MSYDLFIYLLLIVLSSPLFWQLLRKEHRSHVGEITPTVRQPIILFIEI
jgi:hypothetical protein